MKTEGSYAVAGIFEELGAQGFVHARDIDGTAETGCGPDEPVVTASVFKIAVLLELVRQISKGTIDPHERVRVTAADRVDGPTGLSVFQDDAELSLRDLAVSMMTVSDNTATDVIMARVGLDRINATLRSLGLQHTELAGDCRFVLGAIAEDLGLPGEPDLASAMRKVSPEEMWSCRSLRPDATTRTTPREITDLLARIWRDEAAAPEACAEIRRIMSMQVWPHRLQSGFPDEVSVAGKTGTLPSLRNEAGVVEYPDGGRYAVAVFTKAPTLHFRRPEMDAAIGRAARAAVESLRAEA